MTHLVMDDFVNSNSICYLWFTCKFCFQMGVVLLAVSTCPFSSELMMRLPYSSVYFQLSSGLRSFLSLFNLAVIQPFNIVNKWWYYIGFYLLSVAIDLWLLIRIRKFQLWVKVFLWGVCLNWAIVGLIFCWELFELVASESCCRLGLVWTPLW